MHQNAKKTKMSQQEMERDFAAALGLLKRGERHKALAILTDLRNAGTTNPVHVSYAGLAIALTGNGLTEAAEICNEAMVLGFFEPEVYLNLARVYSLMRRDQEALRILRQGVRSIPGDPAILAQLERLNPRKPAAFSVVPRDHWLNNAVGKMSRSKDGAGKSSAGSGSRRGKRKGIGPSIPNPSV